jgi:hypothetical protein
MTLKNSYSDEINAGIKFNQVIFFYYVHLVTLRIFIISQNYFKRVLPPDYFLVTSLKLLL